MRTNDRRPSAKQLLRRVVATVVLVLAVSSLTTAAASAATATADVCFRNSGYNSAWTYTVNAQTWNGTNWSHLASSQSSNGCLRWNVAPGQYVKFQAFYRVGTRTYYMGNSGWAWIESGRYYNFGTHLVSTYSY